MKNVLSLLLISLSFLSCSSDDDSAPNGDPSDPTLTHRYTYTVSGNGIDNVTFTKEIPFDEYGGGMAYFEPENNYEMVSAFLENRDPGINVHFVYINDEIQPLARKEPINQDTSSLYVAFVHENQNYFLESVSGTCQSQLLEIFPFSGSSGKSSFKVSFSGTFGIRGFPDDPREFQIAGEIEVYNN